MYAKLHHNISLSSRDMAIFIFFRIWSSAKPRPMKNVISESQMSFDNLVAYIRSISMYMHNFITIFHSVQETGPFSLFQNFAIGKASTDDECHFAIVALFQNFNLGKTSTNPKCHLTISRVTSCQYQCVRKISSRYSIQFKR